MRRMMILLTLLLSILTGFTASAQDARISIASGVSGGTYRGIYADDLEKQLADFTVIHRLSSGSGENLEMLADGRAAFGAKAMDEPVADLTARSSDQNNWLAHGNLRAVNCGQRRGSCQEISRPLQARGRDLPRRHCPGWSKAASEPVRDRLEYEWNA